MINFFHDDPNNFWFSHFRKKKIMKISDWKKTSGPLLDHLARQLDRNVKIWLHGYMDNQNTFQISYQPHFINEIFLLSRTKFCCWVKKKKRNNTENRTFLRRHLSTRKLISRKKTQINFQIENIVSYYIMIK